jgi:RNA polymerase sigma factor (sigma-70 family)
LVVRGSAADVPGLVGAGTGLGAADIKHAMEVLKDERPSDAELVLRSRAEPELFSTLFDRHFALVHRYLAARVGRAVADDLAAETFTIAFARRGDFRAEAPTARPWLFGIATNLVRNHQRSLARARLADAREAAQAVQPMEEAELGIARADATADARVVVQALAVLDADQRDALLLFAWAELSYEEIARSLSIPIGTVRSRIARGRERLARELSSTELESAEGERTKEAKL